MSDDSDFVAAMSFRGQNGPAVAAADTIVFDALVAFGGTVRSARFFEASALGDVAFVMPDGSVFVHTITVVGRQDFAVRQFNATGSTVLVGTLSAFL